MSFVDNFHNNRLHCKNVIKNLLNKRESVSKNKKRVQARVDEVKLIS